MPQVRVSRCGVDGNRVVIPAPNPMPGFCGRSTVSYWASAFRGSDFRKAVVATKWPERA